MGRRFVPTFDVWHNGRLYPSGPLSAGPDAYTPGHDSPQIRVRSRRAHNKETGDTTSVAVKIRLKRMGKIRAPFYRVVVMDSRTKRDGRAIEEIGKYHPTEEPSLIEIDGERAQYWLKQGAQPTEAVEALLKITGDWQKAKGLEGAEGTLKVKQPKPAKKDLYEAALAAAGKAEESGAATTSAKKKPAKKAETIDAEAVETDVEQKIEHEAAQPADEAGA